jgi:hypothetical protein
MNRRPITWEIKVGKSTISEEEQRLGVATAVDNSPRLK